MTRSCRQMKACSKHLIPAVTVRRSLFHLREGRVTLPHALTLPLTSSLPHNKPDGSGGQLLHDRFHRKAERKKIEKEKGITLMLRQTLSMPYSMLGYLSAR